MISFFRPIGKADTGFYRPIGKADTGFFRPIGKADTGFYRPIGKADTGFYRPISPVGLNTGSWLRLFRYRSIRLRSCAISPVGLNTRTFDLTPGLSGGGQKKDHFFSTSEKKLLDTPIDYAYKPPSPTG